MKTRIAHPLYTFALAAVLFLSACAPAAVPTAAPIAVAPKQQYALPTRTMELAQKAPEATQAPEATAAPLASAPNETGKNLQPEPTMAAANDSTFQNPGVAPRENPLKDHLSTFALDVDTASYTLAQDYIQRGELPPADAVRPEEFINAFDQGYNPPSKAGFSIYADGAPSPFARRGSYLVRVGVQGYRVSDRQRKPSHLTFVIDVSGSMSIEGRLELVKSSLRLLVDRLNESDTVGIVVYGSTSRIALETTPGSEHATILRVINNLHPEGSTNVEAGLRLGYQLAAESSAGGDNNRVILCSDGVANTGNTSADALVDMVHGYVQDGISLVSVGVGMGNYNDALMERLADGSNGSYHYINTIEEGRRLFVEDLTSTLQVIAYNAKVQVDFNPDLVKQYRLIGYENRAIADSDFRNNSVDAGEIGAGMTSTALYEVELVPGSEGRIATVQLRWEDANTRAVQELDGNLHVADLGQSFEKADPHFQLTATVAAWAEMLRSSPYVKGNLGDVANEALRIARLLPEDEQASTFYNLANQAASFDR